MNYYKLRYVKKDVQKILDCEDLYEVSLENRKIRVLVPTFNCIRYLNVSKNNLVWLPEMPLIEVLICRSNRLAELPVLLDNLMTLDCSNNPLSKLGSMPRLVSADISNTLIQQLDDYKRLKQLTANSTFLTEVRIMSLESLEAYNTPIRIVFDLPNAKNGTFVKSGENYERVIKYRQFFNSNVLIDWRMKKFDDRLKTIFKFFEIEHLF